MALRSMTGFGRCELARDGRRIGVEIKTVNHRFLDISIRAPRFMGIHEKALRDVLKSQLERGHVDVFVRYDSDLPGSAITTVDTSLASAYADAAKQIAALTGLPNDLTAAQILQVPDILACEPTESELEHIGQLLAEASGEAVSQVVAARDKEGAALWKDISPRLSRLERLATRIMDREPDVVAAFRQRLQERMGELASEQFPLDEQRVANEAAIFADKCNVTEEVTRIRAHLERFRSLAKGRPGQGRSLDFISQELNREFNTTGSKSQDTEITRFVLEAKAEVEKIREQIQNIE